MGIAGTERAPPLCEQPDSTFGGSSVFGGALVIAIHGGTLTTGGGEAARAGGGPHGLIKPFS